MERNGTTTISSDLLALMLLGPHGPVKIDALTAIVEDRDAGDLPAGVGLGRLDIESVELADGDLVVNWSAQVDVPPTP